MAIQSQDQLIAALSGGKMRRSDWNKLAPPLPAAETAGIWYDTSLSSGNPTWNSVLGSVGTLAHQALSETTTTTATTAATSGNFATNVFTDTTHGTGRFTVGMLLTGAGVPAGTYIAALGTGTGANNGGTYTLSNSPGTISSVTVTGTASVNSIPHGGDVSTDVKHILNASVYSGSATSAPAVWMLIDQLACYTIFPATTVGSQSFTGQAAWPRYADGKGVQAYLATQIVAGAGTPTVQLGYTNTVPTSGRLTPGVPALPTLVATSTQASIPYSGTGAGKYGPFLPLQGGDQGIKQVDTINFSATMTSGCVVLVICKPLLVIPITTVGVAGERDLVNQIPSMPRIYDGACLQWIYMAGAAIPQNSSYQGHLDFAWG
jgi:hypothetical protein